MFVKPNRPSTRTKFGDGLSVRERENVIDSMHKVALEVRNLSEKLSAGGIEHELWMEQPENIPTCLATRPYPRFQVASYFEKLKLCK